MVARKKTCAQATAISAEDEEDGPRHGSGHPGVKVSHTRSKSAPSARPRDSDSDNVSESSKVRNGNNEDEEDHDEDETDGGGRYVNGGSQETIRSSQNNNLHHGSSDSVVNEPFYDLPEGEDYMAIYETIDRKRQEVKEMKARSASMEELETPTASLKSFKFDPTSVTANCKAEPQIPRDKKRHRSKSGSNKEHRKSIPEPALPGNKTIISLIKTKIKNIMI